MKGPMFVCREDEEWESTRTVEVCRVMELNDSMIGGNRGTIVWMGWRRIWRARHDLTGKRGSTAWTWWVEARFKALKIEMISKPQEEFGCCQRYSESGCLFG